jgi:hypothetical protein
MTPKLISDQMTHHRYYDEAIRVATVTISPDPKSRRNPDPAGSSLGVPVSAPVSGRGSWPCTFNTQSERFA